MMDTTQQQISDRQTSFWMITALAVVMFGIMFVIRQAGAFDFWYWMSMNLVVLISLAVITDMENLRLFREDISHKLPKKILMGLGFAVLLYLIFFVGNYFIRLIFENAGQGINNVYAFKQDAPSWRIVLLMALIIGPGEEIFWRGYLQRRMGKKWGATTGFIVATLLYTVVHLATGNMVLVLAAFVCGAFWGWLYKTLHSVTINIVSHTVWDILVFIVLPFSGM
ncbi:MAG: CPBP family intramembrane glutamic endopeptidase [Bacteroidales bacterium]